MSDPSKLRVELDELNVKCQQARENEIRALQRSRVEAERAVLLAQIAEAGGHQTTAAAPYRVVVHAAAELHFAENLRSGLIRCWPEARLMAGKSGVPRLRWPTLSNRLHW
jgi:hypothetical protein